MNNSRNLEIEFYITNPLSPTLRMVLPEEYSLKLEVNKVSDVRILFLEIMKHIAHLYREHNIIAYTDIYHFISSTRIDDTYKILSELIYTITRSLDAVDDIPNVTSVIPKYRVVNNNVDTSIIEELIFSIDDGTEDGDIMVGVLSEEDLMHENMIVLKSILFGMLPQEYSQVDLDSIINEDEYYEDEYEPDGVPVYKYDMKNPKVRINLQSECYLRLEGAYRTEELIDAIIDHIRKIEKMYNTSVYMTIEALPDMTQASIAYGVLKNILDQIAEEPISDELFNNCTGAVFIYDTSKKCMGYQDPNAIIGLEVMYDMGDKERERISYTVDNGTLLDVVPNFDVLMKLMPQTTSTVQLTTEDMKYIL